MKPKDRHPVHSVKICTLTPFSSEIFDSDSCFGQVCLPDHTIYALLASASERLGFLAEGYFHASVVNGERQSAGFSKQVDFAQVELLHAVPA